MTDENLVPAEKNSPHRASVPIRGGLRWTITTSKETLVAGEPFTIFVKIENPFEVPVELRSVSSIFPTEFVDLDAASDRRSDKGILGRLQPFTYVSIGRDIVSQLDPKASSILHDAEKLHRETLGTTQKLQMISSPFLLLEPGDSTTRAFTVKTRLNTQTSSTSFAVQFAIEYREGPRLHSESAEKTFFLRASMQMILLGAAIGSAAGFLLKNGSNLKVSTMQELLGILFEIGLTIITAFMTVVLLARKKDVQPLITVEDIWGGIAVGFLVTYSGSSLFDRLTNTNSQ